MYTQFSPAIDYYRYTSSAFNWTSDKRSLDSSQCNMTHDHQENVIMVRSQRANLQWEEI